MTVVKFGLVGLINTAIGFAIIVAALALGFNDYAANALGYGLCLAVSYSLNRYWTFSAKSPPSFGEMALFGSVFAVAYLANLLVLTSFRLAGFIDQPLAHLLGMAVYSVLFYVLSRKVVFAEGGSFCKLDLHSFLHHRGRDLIAPLGKAWTASRGNAPFVTAVIVTFIVLLLFVGKPIPITIWDEGRIIVSAMEMRQSGLSLVTTYDYHPDLWNTKPPLLIWLMNGSMALMGPTEFALRLPSLLSSLGTILLVMLFLRRITQSVAIATFGGLSLAISVGFFGEHGARTGDYDALLCFFTTGYLMLLFFAVHRQRPPFVWLLLAGALGAGALMTKSVAGVVPVAGFLLYIVLTGRWRRLFTTFRYIAAALLAIIPLLVFLALREYSVPGYLDAMLYNDVFGRFSETMDNHSGPPWYYLESTFVRGQFSLGTAALISPFILPLARGRTRLALTFAFCIALGHLVIITMADTKLQHYYLSAFPFIAIAAALAVHVSFNRLRQLVAAGELSSRRLSIAYFASALLLLIAMGQATQIRLTVLDPRLDYPRARYGALLDDLAGERSPVLLIEKGLSVPDDPHYAPELRFYAMLARENRRDVEQTGDVSRIASLAPNTIIATCDPRLISVLQAKAPDLLLERNGCVARRRGAVGTNAKPKHDSGAQLPSFSTRS